MCDGLGMEYFRLADGGATVRDQIDMLIYKNLKRNGRMGWGHLAAEIGISRKVLTKRFNALRKQKIIDNFTYSSSPMAERDAGTRKSHSAGVSGFFRLSFAPGFDESKLFSILPSLMTVVDFWEISSGYWNAILKMEAASTKDLSKVIDSIKKNDGIANHEFDTILKEASISEAAGWRGEGAVGLDQIDIRILGLLKEDGRMQWSNLASEIGISRQSVRHRVDALMESRYIDQFTFFSSPLADGSAVNKELNETDMKGFCRISFTPGYDETRLFAILPTFRSVVDAWMISSDLWNATVNLAVGNSKEMDMVLDTFKATEGISKIQFELIMKEAIITTVDGETQILV